MFFCVVIGAPHGGAVRLRRTSVLPQAKPWRRRNSLHSRWQLCCPADVAYSLWVLPPSIQMPKGGAALRAAEPKKGDMTCGHVSFFGGGEGSRTPVRKHFNGTFSGRRRLLRKSSFLFPSSLASRHARKSGESHHAWAGQLLPAARTPHQRRLPRSVATPVQTAAFN